MLDRVSHSSRDFEQMDDSGRGRMGGPGPRGARLSPRTNSPPLFGSYSYEEVRTTPPESSSGLADRQAPQPQGPLPLWMTLLAGTTFGLLAVGCVFWSGMGQRHLLVSTVGSECTGEDCSRAADAFNCEDGDRAMAEEWSAQQKAWCFMKKTVRAPLRKKDAPVESAFRPSSLSKELPSHSEADVAQRVHSSLERAARVHWSRQADFSKDDARPPAVRERSTRHAVATSTVSATSVSTTSQTTQTFSSTSHTMTTTTLPPTAEPMITVREAPGTTPAIVQKPFQVLKGISYCPVPVKHPVSLKSDDFMAEASKPLWSTSGRGDLSIIKQLGANAVRLYGNNPEMDHSAFLDEAYANGLSVIPGMSDFPYFQDQEGNCQTSGYNCYELIKKSYAQNLAKGFLTKEKRYHPALLIFSLINEPDLKMPLSADKSVVDSQLMARAVVSAFDAILDAEKEAGLGTAPAINFTSTISFALCPGCGLHGDAPALGQMALIRDAMFHPERYGYQPRNNLADNYRRRWVNSFNTANDAMDLKAKFFDRYNSVFSGTPVFIGEYHTIQKPTVQDIQGVLGLVSQMPLFMGISFFEFQVAYWKGGSEMAFGLFRLGGYPIAKMRFLDGQTYTVWCLAPATANGAELPEALAEAYGGHRLDVEELCLPQPDTVPLSPLGYNLINGLHNQGKMIAYLARMAKHMGALIVDRVGLAEFANIYLEHTGPGFEFADVVKDMHQSPWMKIDARAACVSNPNASRQEVQEAIAWGCKHLRIFSCDDIDKSCQSDVFAKGDWVFSRYYRYTLHESSALEQCSFGGAAIFASPEVHRHFSSSCVLGGHSSQ